MTTILHIRLLGDFRLDYGDTPLTTVNTVRLQSLLAYLVLHRHAPQSRHHLAFLLWPDSTEAQAHTNLRTLFHRLRQALPQADHFLQADTQTLQWRPDAPFSLDVADFERGVSSATSSTALQQTVDLYHGDLWPGCYDDWIRPERERLRQTFSEALERLIELLEYERDYPTAIRYTRRLLQHDPLHEATHRRLMRLYALSGDQAGVERVYQECAAILQRELEVEPGPATREAYERLASMVGTISQRHNLPTPPTPLVGRDSELALIAKLLADPACRLLTLVGPGGIGKTRLALQAARAERGRYLHGVYFVPLSSLTSPEFLIAAIAAALDFSFHGPAEPKTQLLNYLREKELLLTLDSFEHLLPAPEAEEQDGSELLADILASAVAVKILATSRERLNLAGEWLLEIAGLSVPPPVLPLPGGEGSVAGLEAYSAVTLFAQAADRMQPGFSLSGQTQGDVTRICRLVEGMPLALELAAAWVRTLTCAEIAQEIEQKLGFLHGSRRHTPRRHYSMQAVFDPSWKLLSGAERRVFRQLSVFRGGFGREAAEQVADASLPLLAALGDKSLLRRQPGGRYDLHELLRQYAAAKLQETLQEQAAAQARHGHYYLEYLGRRTQALQGSQQEQALADVKTEIDNIRTAWQWAVAHQKAGEMGQAIESLWVFYDTQGWFHEAETLFGQAVGSLAGQEEVTEAGERNIALGQVLALQGFFLFRLGLLGQSRELLKHSLALLRRFEARAEMANTLYSLGGVTWLMGEYAEAQSLLQEALAIYRERQTAGQGIALCLGTLGMVAWTRGDYGEARRLTQQASIMAKEIGNQRIMAIGLNYTGALASAMGEHREAQKLLRESLTLNRQIGDPWGIATSLNHLGALAALEETVEWVEVRRLHQESLAIFQDLGDLYNIAVSFNYLSRASLALGEYPEAKYYSLAALKTATATQLPPLILDTLVGWAALLTRQSADRGETAVTEPDLSSVEVKAPVLTEAEARALELLALALNHPTSTQETKDKAARLFSELAASLPPPQVAAATARGQARNLAEVVAEILTADD